MVETEKPSMKLGEEKLSSSDMLFLFVALLPSAGLALVGLVIFGWQCIKWLQLGVWQSITLHTALNWWTGHTISNSDLVTGWAGFDHIVWRCIHGPELVVWLVGAPIAWVALWAFICDGPMHSAKKA
jgi:hypothetical protein